jgi:hypothetical protein
MKRVESELRAGRAPARRSLRALRRNVQELAPAVLALERRLASHPSHALGTGGVERRLRRAFAGAAALVAALARSGVDTPESSRLVRALERFAGRAARGGAPVTASATGEGRAYTHPAAASTQSWSEIASEDRYHAAVVSRPRPDRLAAPQPASLMQRVAPAASAHFSTLGLAGLAMLLALAVSASLSSFLLSGWGLPTRWTGIFRRRS